MLNFKLFLQHPEQLVIILKFIGYEKILSQNSP